MPVVTGQTGIPPSSQAPQGDSGSTTQTQQQPALIAGKYKSVDEAIVASEQGFHKVSEQLAGLTRVLEGALAPQAQAPQNGAYPAYGYQGVPIGYQPQGGYGAPMDPYGRAPQVDQIDPAAFITNPGKVLQERDERLATRIIGQVADTVRDTVSNALAVADFKINHPEMKKHEMIVQSYLSHTDQRKPMRQRLEDAATLTSNYLKANGMVGGGSNDGSQAPTGNAIVEAPNGGPQLTPQASQGGAPMSEEADFADYIRERNNDFAAKFGIPIQK